MCFKKKKDFLFPILHLCLQTLMDVAIPSHQKSVCRANSAIYSWMVIFMRGNSFFSFFQLHWIVFFPPYRWHLDIIYIQLNLLNRTKCFAICDGWRWFLLNPCRYIAISSIFFNLHNGKNWNVHCHCIQRDHTLVVWRFL